MLENLGIENEFNSNNEEVGINKEIITDNNQTDTTTETSLPVINSKDNNKEAKGDYPDGFDSELYNLETKSLREEAVLERLKSKDEEIKKIMEDLSKSNKLLSSQLKAPEDEKVYDLFKGDEKFKTFYESQDGLELQKEINTLAKENKLTVEQHRSLVNYMNNFLENKKLIDTRSAIEIERQRQDFVKEEYKKLGDNAEVLIQKNVSFVKDFTFFNEEQKAHLITMMDQGALGVSIVNKVRELLSKDGFDGNTQIPTNINVGGLEDDETLWKKFINAKDSQEAEKILIARKNAGRSNEWKHS